ncbi:MAG TPA: aromatic amino acid ammonia-lyase [Burkholderiales bacterium]
MLRQWPLKEPTDKQDVVVSGKDLRIDDVVRVARRGARVRLTEERAVWDRVERSVQYIRKCAERGEPIYGVTTGFGGMANVVIPVQEMRNLQANVMRFQKTGAGNLLPKEDVRAAMLLRANSHLKGASGIRREVTERLIVMLNEGVTPHVREFGSIGASGDLTPLANIAGAVFGIDPCYRVDFRGETVDCITALKRLGLEPMSPEPKEGLAMLNGTSVMTGIAANCVYDGIVLLRLAMAVHALFIQALTGTNQSFHPYIHQMKPHPGQVWAAQHMLALLDGSAMIRDELDGRHDFRGDEPIQDRYSLRCLPQYIGPIVEGLDDVARRIETEMNSANDNPLIDPDAGASYHGGNFLGQYIGVGMDQLRYYLGLIAKHVDAQIALVMAPEFNNGLPASLVGNPDRKVNMGLKGLQIAGNSIMPLLSFLGNSLTDRFPTHAEQFNQNINSQGFGSANLARQSVRIFQEYIAIALIHAVQAVDLRNHRLKGSYDARTGLSKATIPLYEAVKTVVGKPPADNKPLIWNDDEQALEDYIELIARDVRSEGKVMAALPVD